jgi:hypothetical protein
MTYPLRHALLLLMLLSSTAISTGCNGAGQPRRRIGALPFPGIATLYAVADPAALGTHRSRDFPPPPFAAIEVNRGIVYTTRGGFLDLAHVRDTIDWTRYSAEHVRSALRKTSAGLELPGMDRTTFHLRFNYPSDWTLLSDAQRETLVDELAIRVGQQLGYLMMTWHEVQTWYGYKSSGLFSESASAFTYDDIVSHVVGAEVAGDAMRVAGMKAGTAFDAAVTGVLSERLSAMGALRPAGTREAVARVSGSWWDGGRPLKRQLRVGLTSGVVTPWLVPGLGDDAAGVPAYAIPRLGEVGGRDFSSFVIIELEPRAWEANRIRAQLPEKPERFCPQHDLPRLLDVIRLEMRAQFGDDVDET